MQKGFSDWIIQENICHLHIKNVEVENINHSSGTISEIKDDLTKNVKDVLKTELQRLLTTVF